MMVMIRANNPVLQKKRMWNRLNRAFDSLERTFHEECEKMEEMLETMADVPKTDSAVCILTTL